MKNKKSKIQTQIGMFEPSSKICSKCRYHNTELKLEHRAWICPTVDP